MADIKVPNRRFALSFDNVRFWLLLNGFILLVGVIYLGQGSQAAITGQRVHDKQEKLAWLIWETQQLDAEITAASAPDRIEARAAKLGFHPATQSQVKYVTVKDYLVEPAQPPPAIDDSAPAVSAGPFNLIAWLNTVGERLGWRNGPGAAEATTDH